jgi:8-oxo-dGTP diphosphatase
MNDSARPDGLRHWLVAGGIVVVEDQLLLVHNLRRGGRRDWSTPGGVIDEGETLIEGLTREVQEETGLAVDEWHGPCYRVEVTAPELGFFLRVEAHRAVTFAGELVVEDPDGIVVGAEFVDLATAAALLADAPRWVSEPLLECVELGLEDGRTYRYHLAGSNPADRQVSRL